MLRITLSANGSLYCCSDGVRGRGAAVKYLSHNASFHSKEKIAPSNRGIKQLGNAIKYSQNSQITLEVAQLTGPGSEGRIEFKVIDHGIGISEQDIPHIFEIFLYCGQFTHP